MCGRFAFFAPPEVIAREFGVEAFEAPEPRYNISPTQPVPTIRQDREGVSRVGMLRWGLIPRWAKDPAIGNRLINARGETVAEKPAFREAFRRRRCLVLASGFYEWSQTSSGKWPFFVYEESRAIMAFAGLWERWRVSDDETIESCVIITTSASPFLAEIHDRMPVILPPDAQTLWLKRETPAQDCLGLLQSGGDGRLEMRRIERIVNDPRNEGAELLRPAGGS